MIGALTARTRVTTALLQRLFPKTVISEAREDVRSGARDRRVHRWDIERDDLEVLVVTTVNERTALIEVSDPDAVSMTGFRVGSRLRAIANSSGPSFACDTSGPGYVICGDGGLVQFLFDPPDRAEVFVPTLEAMREQPVRAILWKSPLLEELLPLR